MTALLTTLACVGALCMLSGAFRRRSELPRRVLWLAPLLASACIAELEPEVGSLRAGTCRSEDSDPSTIVKFKEQLLPIFQRSGRQGGCGCHQPGNKSTPGIDESGLNLGSYQSLMRGGNNSGATIVVPGDPCASVIVQKVSNGPPFGARMPPGGPPFMSPEEITLLRDWIAEGAHEN